MPDPSGGHAAPAPLGALAPGIRSLAVDPPRPDLLVLDIDGVLIDTRHSYPAAVAAAVSWFCHVRLSRPVADAQVGPAVLAGWKAAGGFNDDWHLAQGVCLYLTWHHLRGIWPPPPTRTAAFCADMASRGGGLAAARALCPGADTRGSPWDPAAIARVCMERYGGDEACAAMFGIHPAAPVGPGLWRLERPLVGASDLQPWRGRLGLYTGRNAGETAFGLRAAGLEGLFPADRRQTTDSGHRKPDPGGLAALAAAARPRQILFVGDTPDDAETVLRYRALRATAPDLPPALFAGVLGGAPGAAAEGLFRAREADFIVADTTTLLRYLNRPGEPVERPEA